MTNKEIDALIAEKVMGIKVFRGSCCPRGEIGPNMFCEPCGMVPSYSYNIEDAFMVVEKMKELGFVGYVSFGPDGSFCFFQGTKGRAGDKFWDEHEKTEIAICKAALKAVGVEVK